MTGFFIADDPRPWSVQPAMAQILTERVRHRTESRWLILATTATNGNQPGRPMEAVLDTLRVLGFVRKQVDRPTVGRKAYVRWWERFRAAIVLVAVVGGLGIVLATILGVTVVGLGFLLEHSIG